MRRLLSIIVRLVTWPVLVVVAINIENAADLIGVSDELTQNWTLIMSWMTWVYDFATTPWVLNVALVALGATLYEWTTWASQKYDARSPVYRKWVTKGRARNLAGAFAKNGFFRKRMPIDDMIIDINERLAFLGLPLVPDSITGDEEVNRAFAR